MLRSFNLPDSAPHFCSPKDSPDVTLNSHCGSRLISLNSSCDWRQLWHYTFSFPALLSSGSCSWAAMSRRELESLSNTHTVLLLCLLTHFFTQTSFHQSGRNLTYLALYQAHSERLQHCKHTHKKNVCFIRLEICHLCTCVFRNLELMNFLCFSQCYLMFLKGSKNVRFETVIEAFTAINMNHNETSQQVLLSLVSYRTEFKFFFFFPFGFLSFYLFIFKHLTLLCSPKTQNTTYIALQANLYS